MPNSKTRTDRPRNQTTKKTRSSLHSQDRFGSDGVDDEDQCAAKGIGTLELELGLALLIQGYQSL